MADFPHKNIGHCCIGRNALYYRKYRGTVDIPLHYQCQVRSGSGHSRQRAERVISANCGRSCSFQERALTIRQIPSFDRASECEMAISECCNAPCHTNHVIEAQAAHRTVNVYDELEGKL
ncbi:hypothetical protein [Acidithiobacillus ferriphilus]|uniref:hypothetical protein n=1 Tax=Acidithiobacillus ferriphilus TaxID=1689834 RepID=UPI002DB812B4|nr:hypothetical protein [Acidithiobacillus ferriphilus]MEB8476247.1 hypothetical protein [Acidithiobacillus ferriphilus]